MSDWRWKIVDYFNPDQSARLQLRRASRPGHAVVYHQLAVASAVDLQPEEMPRGVDAQLDRAVAVLLADVKAWKSQPRPKLQKASERGVVPNMAGD
jgi:hypothetical protein